jgi:hypothetical protein
LLDAALPATVCKCRTWRIAARHLHVSLSPSPAHAHALGRTKSQTRTEERLSTSRSCSWIAWASRPSQALLHAPCRITAWLRRNEPLWMKRSSLVGIEWDLDRQMRWVEETSGASTRGERPRVLPRGRRQAARAGLRAIESQVLHCVLRRYARPRSSKSERGVSTACMLTRFDAMRTRENARPGCTCVEPFPRPAFRGLPHVTHIEAPCQAVDAGVFESLGAGDLLFIDSSHAVKVGSDVVRIYLDIIPRSGGRSHPHPRHLPAVSLLAPRARYVFGWQEAVLVQALARPQSRPTRARGAVGAALRPAQRSCARALRDYAPRPIAKALPAGVDDACARSSRRRTSDTSLRACGSSPRDRRARARADHQSRSRSYPRLDQARADRTLEQSRFRQALRSK